MNIVLLTQDEPFYLADNIRYLLDNMPAHSQVRACVLFAPSPFGKKETLARKAFKTVRIFGLRFFAHYAAKFLWGKIKPGHGVRNLLEKRGIPVLEPQASINSPEALNRIREFQPDLLISIAGNQIFKRPLLDLAPQGCLNLHTALLPKYRGLMPTFWVLKNEETHTGISVFLVDEGIDSGPILVQHRIEIGAMNQDQLICRTKAMGMEAILEAIEMVKRGGYATQPNDPAKMSYFSFPTRADVNAFRARGKKFF